MSRIDLNWIEGWDSRDFNLEKLYVANYKVFPNKLVFTKESGIDMAKIDMEELRKHYPNAQIKTDIRLNDFKNSAVEDSMELPEEDILSTRMIEDYFSTGSIYIFDEKIFYSIKSPTITIYYNYQDAKQLCIDLINLLPEPEKEVEGGTVQLVGYNQGYYTMDSKINATTVDIEKNYNDDFQKVHEDIVKFLESRSSGVVLLYGYVGSGKTQYIRHLATNYPQDYVIIPSTVAEQMASPEFTSFLLDNRNSIFIIEDCEQILKKREENQFGGAVASLLNMADGLMSDICNIKFICTFNADISAIDPALLRKGRCFARYEFGKLKAAKAKKILKELGKPVKGVKDMTLAEIYYSDSTDYSVTEGKTIGF